MEIYKKKTVVIGGIALFFSLLAIFVGWRQYITNNLAIVENMHNQSKTKSNSSRHLKGKSFSKRRPAQKTKSNSSRDLKGKSIRKRRLAQKTANDGDEMLVVDLKEGTLAGNIFGPRGMGKFIVKFNRELENTYKSYLSIDYYPYYLKNDRCIIYTNEDHEAKKIKRKRYGILDLDMPWDGPGNNELKVYVSNLYAKPGLLWIRVSNVTRLTPLSEIEELCEGAFTFKAFF